MYVELAISSPYIIFIHSLTREKWQTMMLFTAVGSFCGLWGNNSTFQEISNGSDIMLQLKALPTPYGTCEKDHVTQYYANYTVPGCRIECETKRIWEKCNCSLVESPGDHPVCTVDQYDCSDQVLCKYLKCYYRYTPFLS